MTIALRAGITRDLKGDFVLEETGLRRIVGVLEAKARGLPHPSAVVFHVRREDDRFYETVQLDDVLADPNTIDRRVQFLQIELRNTDPSRKPEPWQRDWFVLIRFDATRRDRVMIAVHSDDKNWALLLADELEPQLIRVMTAQKLPSWLLVLLLVSLGLFLSVLVRKLVPSPATTLAILPYFLIWASVAASALNIYFRRESWLTSWAGPRSFFCWGDQAPTYARHEEHRRNIQWGVIAGFLVSVGATIFTNAVLPTPPQSESNPLVRQPASKPAP